MKREDAVAARKSNAEFLYKTAQSFESGSVGVKVARVQGIFTPREVALMERAEQLGLKAAIITRTIGQRAEGIR
jgi:hypothetical protein